MAKAKYSSTHHLQKFFIIFGVLFSVAALGIIVFASQKPTNTQSDASGGRCNFTPEISFVTSEGSNGSVTYILKILNNSSTKCKKGIEFIGEDKSPSGWKNYFVQYDKNSGFAYGYLAPQEKIKIKYVATPPSNLVNGTYELPVLACRTITEDTPGDDGGPTALQYWQGNTDDCTSIKLKYTKSKN